MATWIAHLRIAEALAQRIPALDDDRFYVGNIGPDCGVPNADWSAFTPDTAVSHWKASGTIDADGFRHAHLDREPAGPRRLFYLGYWTHLITDVLWGEFLHDKKKTPAYAPLAHDKQFIWTIKKDWYGLDVLYLRSHPESVFYRRFVPIETFPNDYLDYYPAEAFTRQIRYISGYYLNYCETLDRPFPYLSSQEMDDFVTEAVDHLARRLP